MPWRGEQAEFDETGRRFPSLGYAIAAWIEAHCVIPDGDEMGQAYRLTDEMIDFLINYYAVDPERWSDKYQGQRFAHERGGQLVRPQKWGKGPFSGAIVCAEADGPVVPCGWDAQGCPVGRPWQTPLIQITAISEDQTANVFRALLPMIALGRLRADIPDTGETRINLPGGGRIEPVTASARSRLGQRLTFALQDETHSWTERAQGIRLADNQRRNLSGMGGRFLETTNAWDPAEGSVAQLTNETPTGVYVDFPQPIGGSVLNKRERRKAMKVAYGDSVRNGPTWHGWVDLDRIDIEIEALIKRDSPQAERFFLNRVIAMEAAAFDPFTWADLARPDYIVPRDTLITIGVDTAKSDDALAVIATEVSTFHQWPLAIIERPEDAPDDYVHDWRFVDTVVADAFERFNVWRLYSDPGRLRQLMVTWQGRYGEKTCVDWFMFHTRKTAVAVGNYITAVNSGEISHDGDSTFARHIGNACKVSINIRDDDGISLYTLGKDHKGSKRKIDAAMAAVLSAEARNDAIAAGALNQPVRPQWFVGI